MRELSWSYRMVGCFSTTCEKWFFVLKVNIYLQNMSMKGRLARFDQKTCVFVVFLCTACPPASLIMHVPISEVHARWHFSMCLNSQRFLQFHPTAMLVAYANSCYIIIRQNFFLITLKLFLTKMIWLLRKVHNFY